MGCRIVGSFALAVMAFVPGCKLIDGNDYTGRRDYSIDPTARFRQIDLSVLVASPTAGQDVEFDAIFRQHDEVVWAPHFTIFTPEDYASFSVWPMGAKLWEVSGRVSYVPTIYIHKYHCADFQEYRNLKRYERVRIRGSVKSEFENRPWIEIISIEGSGDLVFSDDSLSSLLAGLRDADEKRHGSAIRHLEAALTGHLGEPAQVAAHLKLGWLYEWRASTTRKPEDWTTAQGHYASALSIEDTNAEAQRGLTRCNHAIERGGMPLPADREPAVPEPGATPEPGTPATPSGGGEWKSRYEAEMTARQRAEADLKAASDAKAAAEAEAQKAMQAELEAKNEAKKQQALAEEAAKQAAAEKEAAAKAAEEAAKALAAEKEAAAKAQAELDELKRKIAEGGGAEKALTEKVAALEADKTKLDEQVKALTTERDDLKKKLEATPPGTPEADALKKQIEEKDKLIGEKDKEMAGLKDTIESQKQALETRREQIEKLEKEIEELKKKLEEKK